MKKCHLHKLLLLVSVLAALGLAVVLLARGEAASAWAGFWWAKARGGYSLQERLAMHQSAVEARLRPRFAQVGLSYPPKQVAYVAFKDSALLQVYAKAKSTDPWRLVLAYPILGMSGGPGPKLREGDLQVPEGLYRAEFLNPNSRFHVSIRLNYPNAFDKAQALADGRTGLGSDIMIHGTRSSVGCLAMGNEAAEDLFVLAALVGKEQTSIVVAPTDFRRQPVRVPAGSPAWLPALYSDIQQALIGFPS
jgi:hypothetical protein